MSGLGRKIKGNPGSGLCIAKSDDELGVRHHRCRSEKMVDIDMLLGTRATSVFDIISQGELN